MTETPNTGSRGSEEQRSADPTGPVIHDRRRVDPVTGQVRRTDADGKPAMAGGADAPAAGGSSTSESRPAAGAPTAHAPTGDTAAADDAGAAAPEGDVTTSGEPDGEGNVAAYSSPADPDTTLAEDLKRDLQRLNAEYVNYKRRVDRDRDLHKDLAVGGVIESLLPVLDDIHLARQHGDLEGGPFAAIADKLEATLGKWRVERFGEPGEAFDPMLHEALMHTQAELAPGTVGTTIVQVLQPGYRMADRVIRAARVAVADPI